MSRLGGPAVRVLLRRVLQNGMLVFTGHARREMANDGLAEIDVRNALRGGHVDFEEEVSGTWRYRVKTQRMVVGVAFRSETEAVVVTAWRLGR